MRCRADKSELIFYVSRYYPVCKCAARVFSGLVLNPLLVFHRMGTLPVGSAINSNCCSVA